MIDFIIATDATSTVRVNHIAKATPAGYQFICDYAFTATGEATKVEGDVTCPDCRDIDLTEITW